MDLIEDQIKEIKSIIEDDETKMNYMISNYGPESDPESWIQPMRDKLVTMFKSPLKDEYRLELFKATLSMCQCFPHFSWISRDSQWSKEEIDMFSLLARLSFNEIQIIIPLVERHILVGDDKTIENDKIVERSASHLEYDMLACCFVIIENVIKTLVSECQPEGSNLQDKIDIELLTTLLVHLKEAMVDLIDYLQVVYKNWNKLISFDSSEEQFACAQATIRIAAVWCSEDPVAFTSESQQYLINLFIQCLEYSLKKSVILSHLSHLIVLALHSLCIENDSLLLCIKQSNTKVLDEYRERCRKKAQTLSSPRISCDPHHEWIARYNIVEDIIKKLNK